MTYWKKNPSRVYLLRHTSTNGIRIYWRRCRRYIVIVAIPLSCMETCCKLFTNQPLNCLPQQVIDLQLYESWFRQYISNVCSGNKNFGLWMDFISPDINVGAIVNCSYRTNSAIEFFLNFKAAGISVELAFLSVQIPRWRFTGYMIEIGWIPRLNYERVLKHPVKQAPFRALPFLSLMLPHEAMVICYRCKRLR